MADNGRLASEIKSEQIEFIWGDRIPKGMISVIFGRANQGKGLLCNRIIADVSQEGVRCLYSAAEDSETHMTRPRLEAAEADLTKVMLWNFAIPRQMEQLQRRILQDNIGLVIIDPIAAHLSDGISRYSDNVRDVLKPLHDLIKLTGTAVIVIEHGKKSIPASGHVLDCIGGSSSGIAAAARAAFVYGVDPDDSEKRVLAPAKFNIGREPKAMSLTLDTTDVEYAGEIAFVEVSEEAEIDGFDPMRLVKKDKDPSTSMGQGRPPRAREAACEWLAMFLAQNGATLASEVFEAAKHHSMSAKTLRRAAAEMEIVKEPATGPKCCWDLNAEYKEAMGLKVEEPEAVDPEPEVETGDIEAELQKFLEGESNG